MPSMKNGNRVSTDSPNGLKALLWASRPKTWIASLSPVLIAGAMAPRLDVPVFILTLFFALFLQIGANYANDYFDYMKGTDTPLRIGPKRATAEGWISPQMMWIACWATFIAAVLMAVPLMKIAGIWSVWTVLLCVAFGILYTGGPKPLGYLGLGEVLVFPFFGPIACCGAYYLQKGSLDLPVFIASLAPGFLSCAILIANNLRDEESDRATNKMTLVARWGRTFGAIEYTVAVLLASALPWVLFFLGAPASLLFASLIAIAAIVPIKTVFTFREPKELIPVLPQTALLLMLYTVLFCFFVW